MWRVCSDALSLIINSESPTQLISRRLFFSWTRGNYNTIIVFPQLLKHSTPLLFPLHLLMYSSSSSSSSAICQTTGPKPLPKRLLHIVRSRASSFNWPYPLLSLRSSSSFLRLLPCLLVTSICPFIFPSITCCRRQFLRKMWPIQLAFRFLNSEVCHPRCVFKL